MYIQINTKNILFICGGTFAHLDGIIQRRTSNKSLGFGAASAQETREPTLGEILAMVETEDLLKFGLIPEFIGRFPVISTLHGLNEEDLIRVLTEPKNALTKQYEKLFRMENVDLKFMPEALREIARRALRKGTGARALRSVLEGVMMDAMYDVPSDSTISECVVTREAIEGKAKPKLVRQNQPWVASA